MYLLSKIDSILGIAINSFYLTYGPIQIPWTVLIRSYCKMPPSRKGLVSIEEEDLGLRQFLYDDIIKEQTFHHSAAVRKTPSREKVPSGSTLRLDTNLTQSYQNPENEKCIQDSLISGPNNYEVHKDMVYEEYCIPFKYKLSATGSLWFLLFGFVLFSGTFTTIKLNTAEEVLISKFENIPMFVLGILFCGGSSCALIYLSWKYRRNSIWLVERILLYVFFDVLWASFD
jgi:hypothetical protein